jgi:hypothetical protein
MDTQFSSIRKIIPSQHATSAFANRTPAAVLLRTHTMRALSFMSAVQRCLCGRETHCRWLFRRLGDSILSTVASSICSLEEAQRPAKVIPLVLQCLSESHDDSASICGRHTPCTKLLDCDACCDHIAVHVEAASYSSFLSPGPGKRAGFVFASNAMASSLPLCFCAAAGVGLWVTSTQPAARPSDASAIMLAHAMPHTLMLTQPRGARGKLSIHST